MAVAEQGQQKAARLINDLQEISFTKVGLILLGTWVVILLARKLLPYLAERGPSQLRLYLLGGVPIIRLVMLVVAIAWVTPIVFNITLQNFLVIAGALGLAIGFAFKDYVSSLMQESSRSWSAPIGQATGSALVVTTARCDPSACARSKFARRPTTSSMCPTRKFGRTTLPIQTTGRTP